MSDPQIPRALYPKSIASKLEVEVDQLLSRLYPSFVPDVSVRQGGSRRDVIFGSFDGSFRGRNGRWLIDVVNDTSYLTSQRCMSIEASCQKIWEDQFDSALFILGETPRNRPVLVERLRNLLPDLSSEVATLAELQAEARFDGFRTEYPGPIAKIGHNSEAYHAAIEAIDAVATQLRRSNSIDLRADIRDRLYVEVQAGRTLLEAATVRMAALGNTIVPALEYISDVCAKAALGELAKMALKALIELFTK